MISFVEVVCVELSELVLELEDFDKDVETLTLTLGFSTSFLGSLVCSFSFNEKGPKGILTNGVVVDSTEVEGLTVTRDVGLNSAVVF